MPIGLAVKKLQEKYQAYFSDYRHIKVVLCLQIYYGSGPKRVAKTMENLIVLPSACGLLRAVRSTL